MADLTPEIETLENRYMRAWGRGDPKELKAMTAGNFQLLLGSKPAVILDRASWLEAAPKRFLCGGYRFGDIYVRPVGGLAVFATQVELEARLDGEDWSGLFWLTDLWGKGRIRRRWRLAERVLSRVDEKSKAIPAIRSMQLWK